MFFRLTYPRLVPLLLVAFLPVLSQAQSTFSGYYRFESGLLTNSSGDFLFNRNILQPEYRYSKSDFALNLSVQVRQELNDLDNFSPEIRLREAFVDFKRESFDLRVGQQNIVWGRADAAQIHDFITPMDLSEFLTQDFTDLRTGVTAINLNYYLSDNSFQFIVIPVFNPSKQAEPGSIWSPWPTDQVSYTNTEYPDNSVSNTQFAIRWNNRSNINLDFDASIYHGFNPTPSLAKKITSFLPQPTLVVSPVYRRNTALLLGAEYRMNDWLTLTSEQTMWTSTHFDEFPRALRGSIDGITVDPSMLTAILNSDLLVDSPFLQSLWGVRFPVVGGTLSMQYMLEYIIDHNPDMLQSKSHHTGSILFTRNTMDDRWYFRFLSRYHLDGNDAWINPDITFAGIDGVRVSSGGHVFVGDDPEPFYGHLTFNQFRSNSFIYLKLTAYW